MSITRVVCSKCGKPLEKVPPFLGEGEGAKLFQCDECFYPGCAAPRRARGREVGIGSGRLEGLVESVEKMLQSEGP